MKHSIGLQRVNVDYRNMTSKIVRFLIPFIYKKTVEYDKDRRQSQTTEEFGNLLEHIKNKGI